MQRKDVMSVLKTLKFEQDSTGRVMNKNGQEYFILGARHLISVVDPQNKIPISDITKIGTEQSGDDKIIKIKLNGKTMVEYRPQSFTDTADVNIYNMPLELSDLNDVFHILYPDAREKLFYDVLKERIMVDTSLFGMEDKIVPLTDNILAHYHDNIERKFDELNFLGKSATPYTIRDEALEYQAHERSRNLFLEWVQAHEWDGTPRLRSWFIDLVGATAPPLAEMGYDSNGVSYERKYIESVTEAWFMGAVARQFGPAKVEIVPVLISEQGIGKGNAIRYTAGQDEWFIDTNADIKKPDRFLDSVRGRVIVELSESTQIRGPDAEALKAFISQEEDQLRKAYARNEEVYPRHFVMIASSNLDNIFTDVTGNRRYFPFYCDPTKATRDLYLDRCPEGQYQVEQLWAEALHLYQNGHQYHASEDVAQLADVMQQYSSVENPGIEAIDAVLDNIHPQVGEYTSRQEILQKVFSIPAGAPCPKEYESNYRAWANGTKSWKKVTTNKRINGKVTKGYQRVAPPGETPKAQRLKMKRIPKAQRAAAVGDAIKQWFRAVVTANSIRSFEEFTLAGVPQVNIDHLEQVGLIYKVDSRDGKPIYKAVLGCDSPDVAWQDYKGVNADGCEDELATL